MCKESMLPSSGLGFDSRFGKLDITCQVMGTKKKSKKELLDKSLRQDVMPQTQDYMNVLLDKSGIMHPSVRRGRIN